MKQENRKKHVFPVLVLILVFTLLSGCGEVEVEPHTKTTLRIWCYWEVEANRQAMETLVGEYNRIQNDVEIEVEYIPDEDFKKKLTLSIVDGDMPDLAVVDNADFAYLNSLEDFVDLTEEIPELAEYMPIATEACVRDGRIYGLPLGLNCPALFYNEEMLEEKGIAPPATLEEFVEAAKALTVEGVQGFGVNALQSEESTFVLLPILWSNGGDIDQLNSAESRRAFQTLRTLREEEVLNDFAESFTLQDITRQFQGGRVAMMINSNMCLNALRQETPDLKFKITTIPYDGTETSVVGGEIFAVTPGENQEASIAFLRYLTEEERMKKYLADFGFLAPRQDVLEEQYPQDEIGQEFLRIFSKAQRRENTSDWPAISKVIGEAIQESIHTRVSVEELTETAAQKITEIREGE